MLARNVLNEDMPLADWQELDHTNALLLDVREPQEFARGQIPNAINLPLSQMRHRYVELPKDRDIWTCCGVGQRSYYVTRFLAQQGYRIRNLSGGYTTYKMVKSAGLVPRVEHSGGGAPALTCVARGALMVERKLPVR